MHSAQTDAYRNLITMGPRKIRNLLMDHRIDFDAGASEKELQKLAYDNIKSGRIKTMNRKSAKDEVSNQSVLDGGQTPKAEYPSIQPFVLADRKTVGSPLSPSYWAEEVARALRSSNCGDPDAALKNIIDKAKLTGLSDDQEKMVYWLLFTWQIPVKLPKQTSVPDVESDSKITFVQKQVAAGLTNFRQRREACDRLVKASTYYRNNKTEITERVALRKAQLLGEAELQEAHEFVRKLTAQGYLKKEIVEMLEEELPALSSNTREKVKAALLPAPRQLSDIPKHKVQASLGNAKQLRIAKTLMIENAPRFLTDAQNESLQRIAKLHNTVTPFWFVGHTPIRVQALCKDRKIVKASIQVTGEAKIQVGTSTRFATLARKNPEMEIAWAKFCSAEVNNVAGKCVTASDKQLVEKVLAQSQADILRNYRPEAPGIIDKTKKWLSEKFTGTDEQKDVQVQAGDEMRFIAKETQTKIREVIDLLKESYGYGPEIEKWFKSNISRVLENAIRTAQSLV